MEKPILYSCSLCKLQFPSSRMRYASDGKKLVCLECFSKLYKKRQDTARESYEYKPAATLNTPIMVICTHCRYKFHYKSNFKPICPYCGKAGLKKYEEFTAQKIIDSSRDF